VGRVTKFDFFKQMGTVNVLPLSAAQQRLHPAHGHRRIDSKGMRKSWALRPANLARQFDMNNADTDVTLVALLDRMAADDQAALKALYELTSARLYGVALRVLGKAEWAEDVLQESFLYIWRSAPFYRSTRSPPMAWMCLIVKSRAIDFQRHLTVEKQHLMSEMTEELEQHLAADTPTALDLRHASQAAVALHRCLSALDRPQREVVSLAYLKELSHGELAERLKLPLGTVKSWIRRSLDELRRCMARFA